jgi:DNA-binding IclR family transcriptional regulator
MIKDLNALLVFAKVVEAHSFSEAARRLKMPISTVSRRIVELEDQLGVRLLDRSTRNLRLTMSHSRLGPSQSRHSSRENNTHAPPVESMSFPLVRHEI